MGKIFCVGWLICEVAGDAIPAQEIFYEIYLGVARGQVACGAAKCGGLRADDCHGNLNSIHGGARLVVEIAVSSEAFDREMAAFYAAGGVQEYWLGCWRSRAQWNVIPIRWGDAIRRCGRWSPGWWLRWFCRRWQLIWKGCFRGVRNGLWDLEFSGLEARRPHRLEACVTRRKLGVFYGFQASG